MPYEVNNLWYLWVPELQAEFGPYTSQEEANTAHATIVRPL